MKYAVLLTLGTVAICGYLLFLASPRYEIGELRTENRELRERVNAMERMMNHGPNEAQTIILFGGFIAVCMCLMVCYLMYTECSLRQRERMAHLRFREMEGYKLIFQTPNHPAIPQIEYHQEVA